MDVIHDYATICEQAARSGGQELLRMRGGFKVQEKAPADLLTDADLASQLAIFETISANFPEHRLIGEETPGAEDQDFESGGYTWIVDPLDGTTNYVHDLENYCVSVALHDSRKLVVGAIYDPVRNHCYRASHGGGAYLNDVRIQPSDVTALDDALISVSFPPKVGRNSPEIDGFLQILGSCQAVRRLGSAALNLCYVASGRLDGYWAASLKPWDVAAGFLIVEEAGGCIADMTDGGPVPLKRPQFIATGQQVLNQKLRAVLAASPSASSR